MFTIPDESPKFWILVHFRKTYGTLHSLRKNRTCEVGSKRQWLYDDVEGVKGLWLIIKHSRMFYKTEEKMLSLEKED